MLKVKIISRGSGQGWSRYFPDKLKTQLGGCEFILDSNDQNREDYDWVVVYEDLPKNNNGSAITKEVLKCSQKNTLLVTTEPPNIKRYDSEYTRQFGHVLTSHPPKELPHRNRIYSQPALMWFCSDTDTEWDFLHTDTIKKDNMLSTVCSTKRQKHTLHNRRYDLTMELMSDIPEMIVYGHGIKHVDNKYQMMKKHQYHLAIENYIGLHHWTEKLSDSFLSGCLPFYSGCTNLSEYFPEESYIEIDLFDTEKTRAKIKESIANNEYEKRFTAIKEARRRVLEEYSFFATINKIITENHSEDSDRKEEILSRHAIRRKYPFTCIPRALKKEASQFLKAITG